MTTNHDHVVTSVDPVSRQEVADYPRATSIHDIGSPGSAYRPKRAIAPMSKLAAVQVATYQRYSDDKQGQKSEDRQLERNEEFNKDRIQGTIVRRYTDRGRSGVQVDGRTELEEMLDDASKQLFSVLIIEELSRLARDREDTFRIYRLLACYGVTLYESSTGTKLDLISLVFKAFLAEKERITALTRARHGRTTAVARGEIMHFANYGYMRDPMRPKAFLKHPQNASAVQDIFDRAANGERAYTICKDISGKYPTPNDCRRIEKGLVPASTRSEWEPTSLQRIVENPIYAGILIDGRRVRVHDTDDYNIKADIPVDHSRWQKVDAPELALVSIETWLKAQEAFTTHGRVKDFGQGHTYLLKDLTFCANCGQSVKIARRGKYECFSPRTDCRGIGHLPAAHLERKVLHLMGDVRLPEGRDHSTLKNYAFGAPNRNGEEFRDTLQMELRDLEQELNDDILRLCRTGEASQSKIDHWMRLEQRIDELRRQISLIRNLPTTEGSPQVDLSEYFKGWKSDIPFSFDDPRAAEVIDVVQNNVAKVVIDLRDHFYHVEVHLRKLGNEMSQDDAPLSVLTGSFPNLQTHDDGIRSEVLEERSATFGRAQPSAIECARMVEEIEKHPRADVKMRLQAVLDCLSGSTCNDVAAAIGESEQRVLQWLITYREFGAEILLTRSGAEMDDLARSIVESNRAAMQLNAKKTPLKRRIDLTKTVLLLSFDDLKPGDIAERLSITRKTVFTILIGMEMAGYEGTLKARRSKIQLTDADLDRIREVIATGLDPLGTGSALTQKSLLAWCKEEFKIEHVGTALRMFLSRKGVKVSNAPKLGLSNKDQEGKRMRDFVTRNKI